MKTIRILAPLLLALQAGVAAAEALPDYYPGNFQRTGLIDRVLPAQREMVINDMYYKVADLAVHHTPDEEFAALSDLGQGDYIGFRFTDAGEEGLLITETWLIPGGPAIFTE